MLLTLSVGAHILFFYVALRFIIKTLYKLIPAFHFGAIYINSPRQTVERMIAIADIAKGERIIDLGSGDGRVVIAASKKGAQATGIEIYEDLVIKSNKKIKALNLYKHAHVIKGNFWKHDLSGYDVVFIYGINYIMGRFEKKLQRELKPGSRVISAYFQFPHWKPVKEDGAVRMYVVGSINTSL